jgi:hypothetical protein
MFNNKNETCGGKKPRLLHLDKINIYMNKQINETWKAVVGYEGYYEISNTGKVKGINRKITIIQGTKTIIQTRAPRNLKPRINNRGYVELRLSKNGTTKTKYLHVLLAESFLSNPNNKPEVNHKNGIKTDNSLDNLEMVSHSENMKHAYQIGLIKSKGKPIIDNCSGEVFSNAKEAATHYKTNPKTLRLSLNGKIKSRFPCLQFKLAA